MEYLGYKDFVLSDEQMADFYSKGDIDIVGLAPNEYVLFKNSDGEVVDKYKFQNGKLQKVKYQKVKNEYSGVYSPRNLQQELAFDMLQDSSITVKLLTGTFGTGKSLLLIIHALKLVLEGVFEKIVYVRNNVEVKDTIPIGALPGDLDQKIGWTAGPLMDHSGGMDGLNDLIDRGYVEIAHLGFLRGRDIRNSIILVSEGENLTKEHIQLLLGRVGEGSVLWMDADIKQRDKSNFEKSKGIETMIERLYNHPLFGYIKLEKSERSETAALANLLD